jgi:hypothetical protein
MKWGCFEGCNLELGIGPRRLWVNKFDFWGIWGNSEEG